jgi:dihydroneopterin aldolase
MDRIVFVRGLRLAAEIGVWKHERGRTQPIVVDLALAVSDTVPPRGLGDIVRYDLVVERVQALVAEGHMDLVETLADRIADLCLGFDRVIGARVRVAKLAAMPDADAVGVEVARGTVPPAMPGL